MPDERRRTFADEAIVNVETSHEKSDVDVRALMWFVVIFTVFAIVTHVFLYLLFKFYVRIERKPGQNAPALTAMQRPSDMSVPTEPRLQPFPTKAVDGQVQPPNILTPEADMQRMAQEQNKALHDYGWVDQQKGVVHIPIEEAKKRVVAQIGGAAPVPTPAAAAAGAHP